MYTLVVEDDFASRKVLQKIMTGYGECDIAVDGDEAVKAFIQAHAAGKGYELIFLDIMLPGRDGHHVLKDIREWEDEHEIRGSDCVKIIMTTALDDHQSIMAAFRSQAEGYLVKPLSREKIAEQIIKLELMHA
jgi:two-component system chemotaxis response regulator CheY